MAEQGWHAAGPRFRRPGQIHPARRRDRRLGEHLKRLGDKPSCSSTASSSTDGAAILARRHGEQRARRDHWSASGASAARARSSGHRARESRRGRRRRRHRRRQDGRYGQARGDRQGGAHRRSCRPSPRPTLPAAPSRCATRLTGVIREAHLPGRNPDIVVVDSALIAKAPARFLVAGIGDALSTWFEARSNLEFALKQSSSAPTCRRPPPASPSPRPATTC